MKVTVFGESHGMGVGAVLQGVPPGIAVDFERMRKEMERRAGGRSELSTSRGESDEVQILSGIFNGRTTGTPLTLLIANEDTDSENYLALRDTPRPSHGDWAGYIASRGYGDPRGGGHFSGRLTAPLVAAGCIAKQAAESRGVRVYAHIASVAGIRDVRREDISAWGAVAEKEFPVLEDRAGERMKEAIREAKREGDSVGGSIECAVCGLPAGLGSPDFGENTEGIFSRYLFAIPAVKAVSFGAGTAFASMRGSEANDAFAVRDGRIVTKTNYAGGINGGITNGMPIVFEITFRPTPSIAKPQQSVNVKTMEETVIEIKGRHDPCIVPRAVPVAEAAAALAACEVMGI